MLAELAGGGCVKDGTLQKWGENLLNYGTQRFWDAVLADDLESGLVLRTIVNFLIPIGLRHPSCPTFRVIACLHAWICLGEGKIWSMSRLQKFQLVTDAKHFFAKRREAAGPAVEHCVDLPRTVEEFKRKHPKLAKAYITTSAVQCPLDTESLLYLADTFPLRKPRESSIQPPIQHRENPMAFSRLRSSESFTWDQFAQMSEMVRQMQSAHTQKADGEQISVLPKKRPLQLKDMIADGPPAASPLPPAQTLALEDEAAPKKKNEAEDEAAPKKKKKKKKTLKKKKSKAVLEEKQSGGTTAALEASGGVLQSLLDRSDKKKRAAAAAKAAAKGGGKGNKTGGPTGAAGGGCGKKRGRPPCAAGGGCGKKRGRPTSTADGKGEKKKGPGRPKKKKVFGPPFGCSKCRYLKNGCRDCRGW